MAAHSCRTDHADLGADRSGKTLAAFLACIDRLVRKALAGHLRTARKFFTSPR